MIYRTMGRSGLKIARLGLGTLNFGAKSWGIDEKSSTELIAAYLDAGGNHIDTANMYTKGVSEAIIGKAVKGKRQDVVLTTKCGVPMGPGVNQRGCSRLHIISEVEQSLRRLDTDFIDLFYLHLYDPSTPFEESVRALSDLVKAGKIRYAGLSNYTGWQISELAGFSKRDSGFEPIVAVQDEYSMIFRACEYEVIPTCLYNDIGFVCYSPLGGGILAGVYDAKTGEGAKSERYSSGEVIEKKFKSLYVTERNLAVYREADKIAGKLGTSVATLSIAWLLKRPGVTSVLLGPKNMDHLKAGLAAEDLEIPDEMMGDLNDVSIPDFPYPYVQQNRIIPEFFSGIDHLREYIEIKEKILPDLVREQLQKK